MAWRPVVVPLTRRLVPPILALALLPCAALAQTALDRDADGLPDQWELAMGLDPSAADGPDGGAGDPDGDGLTNAQELAAGSHPRGTFIRHFAEGATGTFFDMRLSLFNVSASPAHTVLRFQTTDGRTVPHALLLAPGQRHDVDPELVPGLDNTAFSTIVEADTTLVADRTMTWDGTHYGSHAERGVPAPSTTWYFAEGATHSGFQLFYLFQNPQPVAVDVDVTYLRPNKAPLTKRYTVAPGSRTNIWVNKEDRRLAWTDVSAVVASTAPIVVERAMYLNAGGKSLGAGHVSAGVSEPATSWFLAEGATGDMFDLFVLVANPGDEAADIAVSYLLTGGGRLERTYRVEPRTRFTIWVDQEDARLADASVSTLVRSTNDVPIIVERAMWWPGPTADTWHEAHGAAGATRAARRWAVADGEAGGAFHTETYILIANTEDRQGEARVTFFLADGGAISRTLVLPASSRTTIATGADVAGLSGKRFATLVESVGPAPVDVVVERAMYSDAGSVAWAAGTSEVAEVVDDALMLASAPTAATPTVEVSAPEVRLVEGAPGTVTVTFTRTTTAGSLTAVYALGGNASAADVAPVSGLIAFTPGQATATLVLAIVDDALPEPPEVLDVRLVPSSAYVLGPSNVASLLLLDNDAPVAPEGLSDAARLLTQATFGPTLGEIARVQSMGYEAWLDEQLTTPRSSLVGYLQGITGETVDQPHVQEAWVRAAATGRDQLRQRVANALLEIMVVSNRNGLQGASWAHAAYMDVLLTHAFGNYRSLLREVTLNPAMGRFLDMLKNRREDPKTGRMPNENYAREVLQLFSIGEYRLNLDGSLQRDVDGRPIPTYGQEEVEGFAHVFTGWTFHQDTQPYTFSKAPPDWLRPMVAVAEQHSPGAKRLLNGAVLPPGQTPEKDLEDALDNIFHHPNVGPFIGRQLIQRLVTSNPSPEYVARVASVFNDNGRGVRGDLGAVVRAILLDVEARDGNLSRGSMYGHLREPMIRFVTVLRAFDAQPASGRYLVWSLDRDMGQAPFRAPSVFNFFSPDFSPAGLIRDLGLVAPEFQIVNESQVTTATNTLRRLVRDRYGPYEEDKLRLDISQELALASDPDALVARLNLLLFAGGLSPELAQITRDMVNEIPASDPDRRVRAAITLLVGSPEFAVQK